MSIMYWKKRAQIHDFDPDTYIVEPLLHDSWLNNLERSVVHASEFFRCRGEYDLANNAWPDVAGQKPRGVPENLWHGFLKTTELNDGSESKEIYKVKTSLWKSYLITCNLLERVDYLDAEGFCHGYFSMLLEHPGQHLAEVVRVPRQVIHIIKERMEMALDNIYQRSLYLDAVKSYLLVLSIDVDRAMATVVGFSALTGVNHTEASPSASFLMKFRMTVLVLDLALVAYMGSHGSQFGHYINNELEGINISGNKEYPYLVRCSQKRLACLDEFLDSNKVWVFELSSTGRDYKLHSDDSPSEQSQKLSILTDMEAFADIWGPVWTVPARSKSIQQYNVSKGFISRVGARDGVENGEIIECHWYSWASLNRGPAKAHRKKEDKTSKDPLIPRNSRLRIGASLRRNESCRYTLDEYESEYAHTMVPLGTTEPAWRLDTRTVGFSAAQYAGINVSGTQKKIPSTTLKEKIWNKITQSPKRANLCFLNQFLVVEISHCTGNSRRRRVKDLLHMERVQQHLEYLRPGWSETQWGSRLLSIPDDDNEVVMEFWTAHRNEREEVAELLCHLLDLLHNTGPIDGGSFAAAYLAEQEELCVKLDIPLNDWAKALRDSSSSAVYAIVNKVCLKNETGGQNTAHCNHVAAHTMFQTQFTFEPRPGVDNIKLEPEGHIFRQASRGRNDIELTSLDTSQIITSRILYQSTMTAWEMQMLHRPFKGERYTAYIRASKISHCGRREPRTVLVPSQQSLQIAPTQTRSSPGQQGMQHEEREREIHLAESQPMSRPVPVLREIPIGRVTQPTKLGMPPPVTRQIKTENRDWRGTSLAEARRHGLDSRFPQMNDGQFEDSTEELSRPQARERSRNRRAHAEDRQSNDFFAERRRGSGELYLEGNRERRRIENRSRREQDNRRGDDYRRHDSRLRAGREEQSGRRRQRGVDIRRRKAVKSSCF